MHGSSSKTDVIGSTDTRGVPIRLLVASMLGLVGSTHLLLWRLLDFAPAYAYLPAILAVLAIAALTGVRQPQAAVPVKRLAVCLALAMALLIVGGEGRLLFANPDWQVRDAVTRDLIGHDWPFVYTARGTAEVLRAPLGVYLWPALAGKVAGLTAADIGLLLQNTFLVGTVLALGSVLFASRRERLIAAAVVIFFSGMDVLGAAVLAAHDISVLNGPPGHLEPWMWGFQFSSHFTQIAWVPQHGLAGWIGGLLFLLWRTGNIRVGSLLAAVPLVTLWSPLSAFGLVPLAAYAGISDLLGRRLDLRDWLQPALAVGLCAPGLLFLGAGGDSVGFRFHWSGASQYILFFALEAGILLGLTLPWARSSRFGLDSWRLCFASLALAPLFQIGQSVDFAMRASIPGLSILAVLAAEALSRGSTVRRLEWRTITAACVAAALVVGAATPLLEMRRAFVFQPQPWTRCSLIGSWDGFTWNNRRPPALGSKSTYLAPVASLPEFMRPEAPARVAHERDPADCWSRPWQVPI